MLKKLLTTLGSAVAVISLGFVGQQLLENWHKIDTYQFTSEAIIILILGALAYAVACYFLSSAWYLILTSLNSHTISRHTLRAIYARSQIAKYIPGNVMQIAGRHFMINRLGVPHKSLAIASLTEIIGLVLASSSFSLMGVMLYGLWGDYINQQQLYDGLIIVALILLLLPFIRKACLKFIPVSRNLLSNPRLHWMFLRAYLDYLLFFAMAGSILVGLVVQIHGQLSLDNIVAIIATFAISWFAGFITPGAPSGIGIRETILMVSIDKIIPGSSGVLIAILFRLITVGGDVLFFFIAGRK